MPLGYWHHWMLTAIGVQPHGAFAIEGLNLEIRREVSHANGSEDFLDGFALIDEGNGTAGKILEGGFGVDAHYFVDGREHIVGFERARDGMLSLGVGGADDLAGLQAAAGEDDAHGLAPVIAAGDGDAGLASI